MDRRRQRFVAALCEAFLDLPVKDAKKRATTTGFCKKLQSTDTIVTTNWDLLLDIALEERQAATAGDYGTDAVVRGSSVGASRSPSSGRPQLLKLHGSFNWLHCQRCSRLYVRPGVPIAIVAFDRLAEGEAEAYCDCGLALSNLLVTPTYLKTYRNRHLANIWARALWALADADEWYFIGYSLPADDVHIKALLLKALQIKKERGSPHSPKIVIVDTNPNVLLQYRRIARKARLFKKGFEDFLNTM